MTHDPSLPIRVAIVGSGFIGPLGVNISETTTSPFITVEGKEVEDDGSSTARE